MYSFGKVSIEFNPPSPRSPLTLLWIGGGLTIELRGPRFWYNSYFIVTMNVSSECSGPKGCPRKKLEHDF